MRFFPLRPPLRPRSPTPKGIPSLENKNPPRFRRTCRRHPRFLPGSRISQPGPAPKHVQKGCRSVLHQNGPAKVQLFQPFIPLVRHGSRRRHFGDRRSRAPHAGGSGKKPTAPVIVTTPSSGCEIVLPPELKKPSSPPVIVIPADTGVTEVRVVPMEPVVKHPVPITVVPIMSHP